MDRLSYPSAPKSPKPYEENDQRIIYLWQEICSAALNTRASDIHVEALKESCCVRLRVDGDLIRYQNYQKDEHIRLIARIKILAKLDIAEQRIPQDGRLQICLNLSSPIIDCRVSTIPTLFGEKVVIRLLNTSAHELNIDHIGFTDLQGQIVYRALNQNHGLILVCGPTGSGKTRTLYSFLNHLNQEGRNLYTVEDPIEICLKGVNQVAYHPKAGLDFGVIIRALLRQDPDVMMIGEIRDRETAALAITAAQRLVKRIDLNPIGGRIAVHEVLEFTNDLCAGIQHNLPLSEIKKIARLEGFTSMYENAKALEQKGIINDSSIIQEIFT